MSPARGNPQLEDGHTRIANELLEALVRYPFTGGELKVVLAVIRLTYGWQTTERPIKQRELVRLTGLDVRYLQRILTKLRQHGVLFCQRYTCPHVYALNKHYFGWHDMPQPGFSVRFEDALSTADTHLAGKPAQPGAETVAAPGLGTRTEKEIKKEKKESAVDPAVENLLQHVEQCMVRALSSTDIARITHLHTLSPLQGQRLLEHIAARMHAQPTGGLDGTSTHDSAQPAVL